MSKKQSIVAYVGTYTNDGQPGIQIYDVKKDGELLKFREGIPVKNPSYIIVSSDEKFLYSIVDEGVAAFKIENDGGLSFLNIKSIDGMRGCYLTVDSKRKFLFVAGFHDGKVSMLKIKKDGSISGLADGVFHRGHAISATERRLDHPKVSCVALTPDEEFLCATDYGLNQMKVYRIDYTKGKLELEDIVRCAMDSAPRNVRFSPDGKFCYILTESSNSIEVYSYELQNNKPVFDLVQRTPVHDDIYVAAAATHMFITKDGKYVFVSLDGINYVSWLRRNEKTGELTLAAVSPVSGDYPKYIDILPDSNELIVLNHDSDEIRDYKLNLKDDYMLMCEKPAKVHRANCICFRRVG